MYAIRSYYASRDNTFESVFNENRNVPDVMVLVESQGNDIKKFKRKYPNYFFYKSDREIFITSKTPIEVIKEIRITSYNVCYTKLLRRR